MESRKQTQQDQTQQEFSFGDQAVADAYDDLIVPALFVPWTRDLVEGRGDWNGRRVLDLATGTGIVAEALADRVGPAGRVVGADISGSMLARARRRCAGSRSAVEFVESSAHPLDLAAGSFDRVVCQQGFQFFPERDAAAAEILRVLEPGGTTVVSTWETVEECEYFGAICGALETLGEPGLAEKMRAPFDFMPAEELADHFHGAGFVQVDIGRRGLPFTFQGGMDQALAMAFATPIKPELDAMSPGRRDEFARELKDRLFALTCDGHTMGRMVSNVLTAVKPT